MPYEDLINNFKTPMYVFDINKLVTRINYLKSKFTNKSLVYAVKANTFVAKELDKYVDKLHQTHLPRRHQQNNDKKKQYRIVSLRGFAFSRVNLYNSD